MNRSLRKKLEQTLRTDGSRAAPAFSPLLHQRVMAALREQGLPRQAPPARARPRSLWRIGIPLALAAALAVAAWITFKPTPPTAPRDLVKVPAKLPPIQLPDLQPAAASPDEALASRKYAYLDRDAKKLWTFVADQLPDLPEPRK